MKPHPIGDTHNTGGAIGGSFHSGFCNSQLGQTWWLGPGWCKDPDFTPRYCLYELPPTTPCTCTNAWMMPKRFNKIWVQADTSEVRKLQRGGLRPRYGRRGRQEMKWPFIHRPKRRRTVRPRSCCAIMPGSATTPIVTVKIPVTGGNGYFLRPVLLFNSQRPGAYLRRYRLPYLHQDFGIIAI